jgi:tetratricopeptide (TPR) repeat protein
MRRLRIQVLAASQAAQGQRFPEAVRLQADARDICVSAGLLREAVVMELVLGSYALHGGAAEVALSVFDQARARAAGGGLVDLAAQALIARGGALLLQRQRADAALAYVDAGNIAAGLSSSPILAIEAFRLAGTVLLSMRNEEQAVAAWQRAVRLAEAAPGDQVAGSSAPAAARALAEVCRRHDLVAQADSLIAQADAWEAGPAVAPPPEDRPAAAPEPVPSPAPTSEVN